MDCVQDIQTASIFGSERMEDMLTCPSCGRKCEVWWSNDGLGPPEYCPMCGAEWDYIICTEENENDM